MSNPFGKIMQHGYIVPDVRAAATQWAQRLGVGPFYVLDRIVQDQYHYRGRQVPLELCLAFGYWGDIQIELIQPLNRADTLYHRALRDTPGVINHCATVVKDVDALIASRGLQEQVIQSGSMPTGLKFVYLGEFLPGGLHLELIQATAGTLQAFAGMEQLAARWDGRDPLRPMAQIGADLAALARA